MKPRTSYRSGWGALIVSAGLVACSSTPSRDPDSGPLPDVPRSAAPPSVAAFERAQQERALKLAQEGRLAEAESAWEVLALLRPSAVEYRDRLEQTRSRIDSETADHWRKAEQARRRGELDNAQSQYLQVLQLQPDHVAAADALRAIEKERNRRSYLGRLSRVTLGKRGAGGTEVAPVAKPAASAPTATAGGSGPSEVLKPVKRATPN